METDGQTPMFEGDGLLAGRYRLLEKVGEGGAAEVFRARDVRLDRIVAIKLLRQQYTHDDSSRRRFVVEAKAAAALSHPNIVDIYDFGEAEDGAMFLAMQFIEGKNLKDILQKRGRLSPAEAITIAMQACYALTAAHAKGLIHRDVKPQNIMIDERGNAHLTDFGVVKALSGPALTQSGMTFGTAAYLSPEQATGETVGPASDIYALGCVMYECLSGQPPFTGDNPAIVAYKQVWEQPRPLHEMAPEVFPSLESIVMRCLNKDPGRRYPNTETLAAELQTLSISFNQPTQAVALGAMASSSSGAGARRWTPAGQRASAELSQPVPMTSARSHSSTVGNAQPPLSVPVPRVTPPTQHVIPGPQQTYTVPPPAPPLPRVAAVNVTTTQRGVSWLPMAVAAVLLLGLGGAGVWLGSTLLGGRNGPAANATASATVGVIAVLPTDTPLTAEATATLLAPTASLTATETPTLAITPTETLAPVTQTPPPPTDTPQPPEPTATTRPEPTPEPPTQEPAPEPTATQEAATDPTPTTEPEPLPADTPTPEPVSESPGRINIQDTSFTGGYTTGTGLYHNVTARWVYGQGTPYSTMSARFNLDKAPKGVIRLTMVAVDSEDAAKTPILITLNDTEIFRGPNPFPNDTVNNPGGPGNWGTYTWTVPAKTLKNGENTLTISNLSPRSCTSCPYFFMLDTATISWSKE